MASTSYNEEASHKSVQTRMCKSVASARDNIDDDDEEEHVWMCAPSHECGMEDGDDDDIDEGIQQTCSVSPGGGGEDELMIIAPASVIGCHEGSMIAPPLATKNKANGNQRGKIQIRRIENTPTRQVTFSKRRSGLLKKAFELSVLCDSQLALVIFSSTGKLYEFANPNMAHVLEKYQRYLPSFQNGTSLSRDLEYWRHEAIQYKETLAYMVEMQRNLMGEHLLGLDIKDLQNLENQLHGALGRVRAKKMQLMMGKVHEYHTKEQLLLLENEMLRCKLAEAYPTQVSNMITAIETSEDILDSPRRKFLASRKTNGVQEKERISAPTLNLGCLGV